VNYTMEVWPPYLFAVTYVGQAGLALACAAVLGGVALPRPTTTEATRGRPLSVIARQPQFLLAVICGVVPFQLMNFIMTSAPLAMRMCGLSLTSSNLGLQWHVIAMYGPSFFTGRLITRFGAPTVVAAGLLLTAGAAAVGLMGVDIAHFWVTLILLGIGWNFGFIGASALVLECHRPEEQTRVQAFNDFLVFGATVVGSFASGALLAGFGWRTVCWLAFPPLAAAVATLVVTAQFCRKWPCARECKWADW
jgi:predicted MFS family arabinose efflux permease